MTTPRTDIDARTIGDLAATLPGAAEIFRLFRVDYCCHGDLLLGQAAARAGIGTEDLQQALTTLDPAPETAPATWETGALIDHVVGRFHESHRRELPGLIELADKIEAVHADDPRIPFGLGALLRRMRAQLVAHMKEEEQILFPAMQRSGAGQLAAPIAQMRRHHDDHGADLRRIEALTDSCRAPEGACRSWQALYLGLDKLSRDLVEHIHLEGNVLFPRFEVAPEG